MNIYEAKADFASPNEQFVLSFEKGDEFDVLLNDVSSFSSWWGACALKNGAVGFIPANYFQKKQLPSSHVDDEPATLSARELHKKTLAELQQREDFQHPGCFYPDVIPAPDYSDSDDDARRDNGKPTLNGHVGEEGIIVPRKLSNPCVESKDRVNLHKELMFNQKVGKNVLNQKSELQKAMAKFQDDHKKKEEKTRRTSLEKKLEEIRENLDEEPKKPEDVIPQSEFQRIHAKVRARMDSQ